MNAAALKPLAALAVLLALCSGAVAQDGRRTQEIAFPELPPRGALAWYDAFISYRWGGLDTELADALFASLSYAVVGTRPVRVFLDRRRLESGRNFTTDFATALAKSKVAVPLPIPCSRPATQGSSFASLTGEQ